MNKNKAWQVVKTPLKIFITGGLLYLVFRRIDLVQVQDIYLKSNPIYFLLALLAFICSQVVSSSRLRGFFKAKGLALPFIYNLKLYFLGMFYNLFLPGGIGGDGYKIYLLRSRFNKSGKVLLGAVFLDRLSGLWAIIFMATLLGLQLPELSIFPFIPVAFFLTGSVVYFFTLWRFSDLSKAAAAKGHAKALAVQTLQLTSIILILNALNITENLSPYLFTFLVSSLVSIFPFTVGGLGAREYVFVLASGMLVMDKHIALIVSLSFYLTSVIAALIGVYFAFRTKEFAATPQENEEMRNENEAMAPTKAP